MGKQLKWFFSEPRRTSCYLSFSIAMDNADVHAVLRAADGEWHFLSEADFEGEEDGYAMSSLGFMAEYYPKIVPLYGLDKGWAAVWDASTNFWEIFEPDESWAWFIERTRLGDA